MRTRTLFLVLLVAAALGGAAAVVGLRWLAPAEDRYASFTDRQDAWLSGISLPKGGNYAGAGATNFTYAARAVRPAVVHIQTRYGKRSGLMNRFRDQEQQLGEDYNGWDDFFNQPEEGYQDYNDPRRLPQEASGSGVIISDDGYIVTNNHVVTKASDITVVLDDKRRYKARVVGTDPTTDLSLLRIDARNLPFVRYGNSDSLEIGEWVLAIGNPFELTSTVTAGIVSAKARNINILTGRDNMAVESFIQTDAAVNPGNSGGALVNLRGELIGINTAIASTTGTYAGYSFAIPVTLVKKVMDDLLRYGEVQRALLGVSIRDVDADLAEAKNIPDTRGVYVAGVLERGAAGKAGLKEGDIILKINGIDVNSVSSLQEYVARYRPGDKLRVSYERGKQMLETAIVLRNAAGSDKIARSEPRKPLQSAALGATLQAASGEMRSVLGISGGVEVTEIDERSLLEEAGMQTGFVITYIDKKPMVRPEDVERIIKAAKGGLLIEGMYPDGRRAYYALGV